MIKLNPKYRPLFSNKTRYNVVSGGRGSSKSYSVSTVLVLSTLEQNKVILFTRYTMTSVGISIFPEFLDKIEQLGLQSMFEITKTEIINKQTGSKIIFRGIKTGSGNQTANLKSIANIDTLVVDEAEEIPDEETFDKIDLSIRSKTKHNKIILIFNPTTKASWLYQRFFLNNGVLEGSNLIKNDITYIHTTYLDNIKNLNQSFIDQIEKMKIENLPKYNHIIIGGFLDVAEGVIFTNWVLGDTLPTDNHYFGADWGFSVDPTALLEVSIDKSEKIIYLKEHIYTPGLTTTQIVNKFKTICGKTEIIGDTGGGGDRIIADLEQNGLKIRKAIKGPGSVKAGIQLILDYKLIVDPKSLNLIKELQNYCLKNGEPIDMYNHLIDGLRMVLLTKIKAGTPMRLY